MTQFQFEMICKVIESGAPALSNELCSSLNDLVVDRNQLAKQVEDLKSQLEQSKDVVNKAEAASDAKDAKDAKSSK